MYNHLYNGIKVTEIIDELKPKLIVELGIGNGENALGLLAYTLKNGNDYKVISISDSVVCVFPILPEKFVDRFLYMCGVSYKKLADFQEIVKQKIDLCIIDTDHNYWTLKQELKALVPNLSQKCVVVMHDTNPVEVKKIAAFYGRNRKYACEDKYPYDEIVASWDREMTDAIDEFLESNKEFSILKQTDFSHGAVALART